MIKVPYTTFKENFMFKEVSRNCRFGYARVSSQTQEYNYSLEAQKQEFIQKGVPVKNIRVEEGSAADKIQDRLYKKGVRFISLDLPYSNDMAVNQLIAATNLAAIATF